jgi:hypothetical protein
MDSEPSRSAEPVSAPRDGSPRRASPRPDAPDLERAERIGEFSSYPQSRTFVELLIDSEEDRTLRLCSSGCWGRRIEDARGAPGPAAARRSRAMGNG